MDSLMEIHSPSSPYHDLSAIHLREMTRRIRPTRNDR
jgi:hypothetical protein